MYVFENEDTAFYLRMAGLSTDCERFVQGLCLIVHLYGSKSTGKSALSAGKT